MRLLFKKILVNMLVLMVVMLPLRIAFAMDMSMNHCKADLNEMEMTMTNHADHQMPSSDLMADQQEKKINDCACCNQCEGDCTGCVHISSMIIFELLQFSDLKVIELVSVVSDSLLTRTISPPSRPPLIL